MSGSEREVLDPKFSDYLYAKEPTVKIYKGPRGSKSVANVLFGEWMKRLSPADDMSERIKVRYRGGIGYVSCEDISNKRCLEVYFIDVDQGDSILIQTPDDRRILVDGGRSDAALNFIKNKYCLKKNYIDFDAVIATHCDNDHLDGLTKILSHPKILVKRVYHNGLFQPIHETDGRIVDLFDRPEAGPLSGMTETMKRFFKSVKKAEERWDIIIDKMLQDERWQERLDLPEEGFVCKRLDASDGYLPPYDNNNKYMTIEVLWPYAQQASYCWYTDPGKTVNGNSVVLKVIHGENSILLSGDLNEPSMEDVLLKYPQMGNKKSRLNSDVYKAAHHGSQHFSVDFLNAVKANAAVISSGDDRYDQHGHPRAVLLGTITRYSEVAAPAVFSTELAACFRKLSQKEQKEFDKSQGQLYERAFRGIIHLRSDGKQMFLANVFGDKPSQDLFAQKKWGWDIWCKPYE